MSPRSPGWPPRFDFSWLSSKPSASRSLLLLSAPSDELHPTTIKISSCYMIFNRGKGWKSETPQNSKSADKGNLLFMFFFLCLLFLSLFFLFPPNPFSTTIAIRIGVKYYFMDTTTTPMFSPLLRPQDKRKEETFCNAFWIL